ncbi:hypothetical protein [Clostridium argentinense]|nr:hypothetical protein [Clostridium argentinense]
MTCKRVKTIILYSLRIELKNPKVNDDVEDVIITSKLIEIIKLNI